LTPGGETTGLHRGRDGAGDLLARPSRMRVLGCAARSERDRHHDERWPRHGNQSATPADGRTPSETRSLDGHATIHPRPADRARWPPPADQPAGRQRQRDVPQVPKLDSAALCHGLLIIPAPLREREAPGGAAEKTSVAAEDAVLRGLTKFVTSRAAHGQSSFVSLGSALWKGQSMKPFSLVRRFGRRRPGGVAAVLLRSRSSRRRRRSS